VGKQLITQRIISDYNKVPAVGRIYYGWIVQLLSQANLARTGQIGTDGDSAGINGTVSVARIAPGATVHGSSMGLTGRSLVQQYPVGPGGGSKVLRTGEVTNQAIGVAAMFSLMAT